MAELSNKEHELVALGAAIASNCVRCAEFHIAEARKLGVTDAQIVEAVRLADKVRQVPARKALRIALTLLNEPPETACGGSIDSSVASARQEEEEHPCCR